MNDKQLSGLFDWCEMVFTGFYDNETLKDKIKIELDESTMTVTIKVWDVDQQEFDDFKP